MYYTIAGIVFFATFAMMVREGLWNNLINLIAILIGGITAFGIYEPITIYVDEATGGSYTYLLDLTILWGVFTITTGVLKAAAQALSKTRVLFSEKFDYPAGAALGAIGGMVMCAFAMATLHTAPLSRDSFGGGFIYGETRKEVAQAIDETSSLSKPDLGWLRLMETLSSPSIMGGSRFSTSVYVHQHAERRRTFESMQESIVKRS